jgi:hypothetical protein
MEFLLIGWFVQLAMGVAFWIVPRFSSGPPRGNVKVIWISFLLINAGLLIGTLQLWFNSSTLLGRVLEICAGVTFMIGLWRRIKPQGMG